jgi:hypothetical protein
VKCSVVKCSEVEWSVVKCREGLGNRASNTIRRYTDHTKFAAYMAFFAYHILSCSFGSIFYHCIYGCVFCVPLFNFVNYVFLMLYLRIHIVMFIYSYCYVYELLLLCMFRLVYSVSLCCSVYCLCVNVCCTTANRCQPSRSQ